MKQVHQHIEGWVAVRTPDGTYSDSLENLERDFGVQFPTLPEGAVVRLYTQGDCHPIQDRESVIDVGPMPWPLGDQLIESVQLGVEAQAKRAPK